MRDIIGEYLEKVEEGPAESGDAPNVELVQSEE